MHDLLAPTLEKSAISNPPHDSPQKLQGRKKVQRSFTKEERVFKRCFQ